MSQPLLVVLDTSVWVQIYKRGANPNPSQPYLAIFDGLCDDEFIPVFSRQTYEEALYILTRSKPVAQQYGIDQNDAREFLESIYYDVSEVVEISGNLRVSTDPKDDMFVETAIAAQAAYLVRHDRDLREPAVHAMLNRNGVRALFPKEFRKALEARRSAPPSPRP